MNFHSIAFAAVWEVVFLFQDARVILAREELRSEICNGEGELPLRVGPYSIQDAVCVI